MATVIVFGPTGDVGSFAATSARSYGAKVILAMRDTKKTIPGLTAEQEKTGGYQRVHADLTDAESVSTSIKSTGATRAYFYLAHGSPDSMKASIQAMKEAGIKLAVFLSTASIEGDPKDVTPNDIIPFVHAQVELNLAATFAPEEWVALRCGSFASNISMWHATEWSTGVLKLYNPDFIFDNITPNDMGSVAGAVLAKGVQNNQRTILLYGPEKLSQRDNVAYVSKVLGKDFKIEESKRFAEGFPPGVPQPIVDYLGKMLSPPHTGQEYLNDYETGVANIELYTGRPALKFEEWVVQNKETFVSATNGKA